MRSDLTAAILVGGRSSRFGADKALYEWRGKTLLSHVAGPLMSEAGELFIVAKDSAPFAFMKGERVKVITDGRPEPNPFWGLLAALEALQTGWLFLCSCDVPLIRPALIRSLCAAKEGALAVAPTWGGTPQPLAALYSKNALHAARQLAAREANPSPKRLLNILAARLLDEDAVKNADPGGFSFMDVDTRETLGSLEPFAEAPDAL